MENKRKSEAAPLILRLIDRSGNEQKIPCDSIRLYAKDDARGRAGGWLGIHPGHIGALIALSGAPIHAYLKGKEIFTTDISGGIASVEHDVVTLLLD